MKEIHDYLNNLSVKELIDAYENEYIPFRETGICPPGIIRTIADMFNKVSGTYEIRFSENLFITRCAEIFYNQNK